MNYFKALHGSAPEFLALFLVPYWDNGLGKLPLKQRIAPHTATPTVLKRQCGYGVEPTDHTQLEWHNQCLNPPSSKQPGAYKKASCRTQVSQSASTRELMLTLPPSLSLCSGNLKDAEDKELEPCGLFTSDPGCHQTATRTWHSQPLPVTSSGLLAACSDCTHLSSHFSCTSPFSI